ncbi:MAG: NADP-dependent isocitrate dehydrogenase, partial [Gammaproteobacteria bacterium]|nr:NADP-dependent isocitrate dehydrogenase [Gammaproteobacteria bacterium]
ENHLRWDSLGEFLALAVSLEDMAQKTGNAKAQVLADALNTANSQFLNNNKSPSRKTGELDIRGSHFYLAMYWAQALASQTDDAELKAVFEPVAKQMMDNEKSIVDDLLSVQGVAVDLAGYYRPNTEKTSKVMRPCDRLNALIDSI